MKNNIEIDNFKKWISKSKPI